jgi:hypothetical protein
VTEGVHRARRVGAEVVGGNEDHARRAERQQRIAVLDDTDADGTRRIVAAARRNRHLGHAPELGDFGSELAGDRRPFEQGRHLRLRQSAGGEDLVAPAAATDVEPQGAGAVRQVRCLVAGHQQPDIVLRQ